MTRTMAEQKSLERRMRIKWLKSLMAMGINVSDMARLVGMERTSLIRMFKLHGLEADWKIIRAKTVIPKYQSHLDAGRTMGETAEIMGVTRAAVYSMENNLVGKFRRVRPAKPEPSNVVKITANPRAIMKAMDRQQQNRMSIVKQGHR